MMSTFFFLFALFFFCSLFSLDCHWFKLIMKISCELRWNSYLQNQWLCMLVEVIWFAIFRVRIACMFFDPFNESVTVSHTKTVPICGVCIRTVPRRTKKEISGSRVKNLRTLFVVYTRNTNWFLAAATAAAPKKNVCSVRRLFLGISLSLSHSPCVSFSRSCVDSTQLDLCLLFIANG